MHVKFRSRVSAALVWNYGSLAVSIVLQAVQLVVVSRFLAPEDIGLMSMCVVVIGVAEVFAGVGASSAVVRERTVTASVYGWCSLLNYSAGVISASAIFLSAPLVARAVSQPGLETPLRLLSVGFLIVPVGIGTEMLLRRNLEFGKIARLQGFASVTSTVVTTTLAVAGEGVDSLIWGFLTNRTVFAVGLASQRQHSIVPGPVWSLRDLWPLLRFGIPQMLERALDLIGGRIDYVMIGLLMGPEELGFYAFSLNIVTIPAARLNVAVTSVAFPALSRLTRDRRRFGEAYLRVIRGLTALNAPLMLGLAATAPLVVPLVFGAKWMPAVPALQLLSFVGLVRSIGNPVGALVLASGAVVRSLIWNIIAALAASLGIWFGAVTFGDATGVAASCAVVSVALFVPFFMVVIRPLTGVSWRGYVRASLSAVVAAALAGASCWCLAQFFQPGSLVLTAQFVLFCAVYAVLLPRVDPSSGQAFVRMLRAAVRLVA